MPRKRPADNKQMQEFLKLKKTMDQYREVRELLAIVRGDKPKPAHGAGVLAKRTSINKRRPRWV